MFFRFCWNTPLGRVSRGFCDWLMCSILGFKELTDSSRSRSPSWRLLLFPPTHPPLWPIISRKFSRFVVDYKCFEATALEQGRNINSFLGSDRFTGFILAVRMKFS